MSKYIELTQLRLKIKDAFVVKPLLKNLEQWFGEEGWKDIQGGDNAEQLYAQKMAGPKEMLEIWFWWRFYKYPLGQTKKSAYLRYGMNLDMRFLAEPADVEILHKGKKVKVRKGEIEIFITPYMELDYRNEWKKEGILGFVSETFRKKIYRKEIENHKDYVYLQAYQLQNIFKQYFGIETFMPEDQVTHATRGLIE